MCQHRTSRLLSTDDSLAGWGPGHVEEPGIEEQIVEHHIVRAAPQPCREPRGLGKKRSTTIASSTSPHAAGSAVSQVLLASALASLGGCRAGGPRALSCRSGAARPAPRDLRRAAPYFVLIYGLDGVQSLVALTNCATEDNEAVVDVPVRDCGVPGPALLVPDLAPIRALAGAVALCLKCSDDLRGGAATVNR